MSFQIAIDSQKYDGFTLGRVILDNLADIQRIGGNYLSVQVCNEHWHGSFPVPSAMGFSTPIEILKGASISVSHSDRVTEKIFDDLKKWNEIFSGKLVRMDVSYAFTSDKKTCSICVEDYESGDQLTVSRKCGHIFHLTCLRQWKLSKKEAKDILISRIMEKTIQHECPLCREHTD